MGQHLPHHRDLVVLHLRYILPNQKNNFRTENIGQERYGRLTVPPGIWFGLKGETSCRSLLMNLADIEHDPEEVQRKSLSEITYNWSLE